MAKQHPPRFLAIVEDAKQRIQECTADDVKSRLDAGEQFEFIDVREESVYAKGHAAGARHLGKGIIERDIEHAVPDPETPIVLYCGGGYRSALAADALQKMGYRKVISMDGGGRAWQQRGYATE